MVTNALTKALPQKIQTWIGMLILLVMVFAILTALGFEIIGGYMPCKLCLKERIAYYIGIPLTIFLIALLARHISGIIVRLIFIILALLMLYNLGLSIYHAGAEYKFWSGPTDCSATATAITVDANNLLANLNSKKPPSCDTAAGYFLGLSFAGWNAICCFFLMIIGFVGAFIPKHKQAC